ncbi:hypothetical protein CDL15_Pgr002348 [Punica granatum]|uniref:Uncharacterized protein n=1 Tax=Punica granatum TaxID=22663 RepID=A0A218XVP2_PUNGR|nr:hypothetical protein CDL15_Pgr002348 [Punica granatum]
MSEAYSPEQSPSQPAPFPSSSIRIVPKSASDRLLGKFFDASQFDYKYDQSSLWSPPIHRTAFLDLPGNTRFRAETGKMRSAKQTKHPKKGLNWRRFLRFNVRKSSVFLSFFNIRNRA